MAGIKDLKNKVVVVTGAGSGIGRATAIAFAKEGSVVVCADVAEDRLAEVAGEIEKLGAKAIKRKIDVSDKKKYAEFADSVISETGQVDVLHNNAGVSIGARVEDMKLEDWEWITGINFWGVVYGIHFFLPHMIKRKFGHIVNTSSVLGLASAPGVAAYAATKHAVAGISESLRAELKQYGIGVTTLCPGIINTRIISDGKIQIKAESKANVRVLEKFYKEHGWPPERVAKAVIKAVKRNKSVVPVGPEAWGQWYLKRSSQKLYESVLALSDKYFL